MSLLPCQDAQVLFAKSSLKCKLTVDKLVTQQDFPLLTPLGLKSVVPNYAYTSVSS